MLRKVKIKAVPKARTGYQVQGSLANDVPTWGGADYNAYIGQPNPEVNKTLTAVPREAANLEAEGGETVVGNIDGSMMPSFYTIKGPRHSSGGVPLNLPDDSFIFSDTKSMKITDPALLKMFNLSQKKGGYTPAEMSKKFDINNYRKILQDPNSDKIARKTAEMMIKNYTMKLGALALAQESKKGFPQGIPLISQPYMESVGIKEEDVLPTKVPEEVELQQAGMQQEMPAPETMPNGEPVAMPQEMGAPEMMEQPMEPMAQYGMEIGSFYPEYAYGGYFDKGGDKRELTQAELEERRKKHQGEIKKVKGTQCPEGYIKLADGTCAKGTATPGSGAKSTLGRARAGSGAPNSAWGKTICAQLSKGVTPKELADQGHGTEAGLKAKFADCIKKGETASTGSEEVDFVQLEQEPPTTPPKKKCECTDPDTGEKTVFEIDKDEDCVCEENETVQQSQDIVTPPERNPQWWLQDTINTMGAFGTLGDINKTMPYEARADLDVPRGVFYSPERELTAQNEQANIIMQGLGQFAGPQAASARAASVQGQAAKQAADTLSRYNNMNVGLANQLEQQQVGIQNQEKMMNQQMATRVYDKNTIAQQQYDNAKRQAMADLRTSYNTALTNRAKTDALNQLYPNYQVDPTTGGLVNYTPTDKNVDPGVEEQTAMQYVESISHLPPKMQELLFKQKFGRKGGQMQKGGSLPFTYMFY